MSTHRTPSLLARSLVPLGALTLFACGGGGGSSSGASNSPPPSPPASATLVVSTTSINANSATGIGGGPVINNPLTFSVSNAGNSSYYYSISYIGTAIGQIATNGVTSTVYNKTNSTVGNAPKLAYAIGATINGTMFSNGSNQFNSVTFVNGAQMGAGMYSDTVSISVCTDATCQHQISGSPQTVNATYIVTGNPISDANVTVYTNVIVEAPSTQATATTGIVNLTAANLPTNGAYVSTTPSKAGLITSTAFQSSVPPTTGATVVPGTVTFTLLPPSAAGAGVHTDSFQINVCFDAACAKPAIGSPWTASISYVVDASAGRDYTQQTLALSIAGMVWDPQTASIYAIIPGYSTQYPNTLAQINPVSGTVETTVQLNGGVGHIEAGTLAVSDDGNYIYVAISNASGLSDSVERIRTSDLGLDLQITLPANNIVSAIREAPAKPHILAIELTNPSPGLVIYNDAVASGPPLSGTTTATQTSFAWGGDSTTLFADVAGVASGTMDTVANAVGGPTATKSQSFAALGVSTVSGNMYFAENLLLWDNAAIFNPVSYMPSAAFNLFASTANGATANAAAYDASLDRAYFLTSDQPVNATSRVITLQGSQLSTQSVLWLTRFQSQNGGSYLIRWGNNGLAFAETDTLELISGSVVTQ